MTGLLPGGGSGELRVLTDSGASAFTATTTETSIVAAPPTIAANTVAVGDTFLVCGGFLWTNATAANQNLKTTVYWGTTAMAQWTTPDIATNANPHIVEYELRMVYAGSNNWNIHGKVTVSSGSTNSGTAVAVSYSVANCGIAVGLIAAEAPTSARVIDVKGQMSTATAGGTVTPKGCEIYKIPVSN